MVFFFYLNYFYSPKSTFMVGMWKQIITGVAARPLLWLYLWGRRVYVTFYDWNMNINWQRSVQNTIVIIIDTQKDRVDAATFARRNARKSNDAHNDLNIHYIYSNHLFYPKTGSLRCEYTLVHRCTRFIHEGHIPAISISSIDALEIVSIRRIFFHPWLTDKLLVAGLYSSSVYH